MKNRQFTILIPLFQFDLEDDIDPLIPIRGKSLLCRTFDNIRSVMPDSNICVLALEDQILDENILQKMKLDIIRVSLYETNNIHPSNADFIPGKLEWLPLGHNDKDMVYLIISPFTMVKSSENYLNAYQLFYGNENNKAPVISIAETLVHPKSVFAKKDTLGDGYLTGTVPLEYKEKWHYDLDIQEMRDNTTNKVMKSYQDYPLIFEPDGAFLVVKADDMSNLLQLVYDKKVIPLFDINSCGNLMIRSWLDIIELYDDAG